MQSIFRYPGGKSRRSVREWILSHRPEGAEEYREPFVGGGGVFFAATGFHRRRINDLNAGLVAVYQALQERPRDFLARCRSVTPGRLLSEFDRVAGDANEDPAFRYFLVNRVAYGGMVNFAMPCRTRLRDPAGWNIVQTFRMEEAAATLAGVRVTHGDYAPLLDLPGRNVWVYCDPPYVTSRTWPAARVYEHYFVEADHRRFAEAVKRSPHKVAVSYGDDPAGQVRSLFPRSEGFHVVEASWFYGHSTDAVKRSARELLILNYPPPAGATTLTAPQQDRVPAGRPPSQPDLAKRRAFLALLKGPDFAGRSVAWMARTAGVSWSFADKLVREAGVDRERVRASNGKTYPARIVQAA